jgi:hypothetical protein
MFVSCFSHSERWLPARVRDLTHKEHIVFLFCLLVLIGIGWTLYAPLLDNDAGDSDDHIWLADTSRRNTLQKIFDPTVRSGNEAMDSCYVPVQSFLYHVSANVFEQRLIPARVFGVWAHILNACLILILAFRFTGSIPIGQLSALFFLLHPRNMVAISWLCAAVAHGIALFLYLAAFLLLQTYLHRGSWWRMALGVLIFAVGVTTKEFVTVLAAAVLLYDSVVVVGLPQLWPPRRKVWLGIILRSAPLFLIVLLALYIQSQKYEAGIINNRYGGTAFGLRPPLRVFELMTLLFHTGRLTRDVLLGAMGAVVAAWMAGLYLVRHKPVLLFLLLWLPLTLAPYSFVNFRDVHVLGRYVYEASVPLILFGAIIMAEVIRRWPKLTWPCLNVAFILLARFVMVASQTLR